MNSSKQNEEGKKKNGAKEKVKYAMHYVKKRTTEGVKALRRVASDSRLTRLRSISNDPIIHSITTASRQRSSSESDASPNSSPNSGTPPETSNNDEPEQRKLGRWTSLQNISGPVYAIEDTFYEPASPNAKTAPYKGVIPKGGFPWPSTHHLPQNFSKSDPLIEMQEHELLPIISSKSQTPEHISPPASPTSTLSLHINANANTVKRQRSSSLTSPELCIAITGTRARTKSLSSSSNYIPNQSPTPVNSLNISIESLNSRLDLVDGAKNKKSNKVLDWMCRIGKKIKKSFTRKKNQDIKSIKKSSSALPVSESSSNSSDSPHPLNSIPTLLSNKSNNIHKGKAVSVFLIVAGVASLIATMIIPYADINEKTASVLKKITCGVGVICTAVGIIGILYCCLRDDSTSTQSTNQAPNTMLHTVLSENAQKNTYKKSK